MIKLSSALACALVLSACSSSPPPPAADPSLAESGADAPAAASVKASSPNVEQAMQALQNQDFARAKTLLEQARRDDPNDAQAAFYLGVADEGLGDRAGAKAAYKSAIELDPKLPAPAVNLSQLLLDDQDAAAALAVVDAALAQSPKHPDLLLNRAVALEALGKQGEALAAYADAAAARPNDLVLHAAYGQLLAEAGKQQQGLAELQRAAASDDPALLASIASIQTKLHAYGDCLAAMNRALDKKRLPALFVRRGICKEGQHDGAGAEADYRAALALDANFAPAHHYLGLHLAPTDKRQALEHLDRAAALAGARGIGPEAKRKAAELRGHK